MNSRLKTDPVKFRQWQERSRRKAIEKRKAKQAAQRKEEFTRHRGPGPTKPTMKKVTAARARQQAEYLKLRIVFLIAHPACGACLARGFEGARPSQQIHHSRGKIGRLLCDTRFFIGVCAECHDWIHKENPNEARALGLLAESRDWNVYPGPPEEK